MFECRAHDFSWNFCLPDGTQDWWDVWQDFDRNVVAGIYDDMNEGDSAWPS